jgi:ATP-binding protein involved in chromosome partitioning
MPIPTKEEIKSVLAEINDPELHRSIVELNMVRAIAIDGTRVAVDIALTIPGCPLKSFFEQELPAKLLAAFPDITDVKVNLGAMTEEERKALVGGVKEESPSPFARSDSSTNVIAIGSGKGGVGKSTCTVNLAAAISKRGFSVGLLDADVWGFSIPRMLGVTIQPTVIDERLIAPVEAYGFKTISIGNFVAEDNPVIWRGPMLHKALQQFLSDVYWEEPQYLLIDMPPGTGDVSMSMAQFVPGASFVMVTTPQMAAERVAERAGHMANKVGLHVAGVIENMAYAICDQCGERTYPFGSGGGKELADKFNVPLLGQVPLDPPMRDFADHGKPSVISLPESPSAQAFEVVVDKLLEAVPPKPKPSRRKSLPMLMTPTGNGATKANGGNGGHAEHAHQHHH